MTGERHLEDQAGGTYGSAEAAMGWRRSSAARAQLLAPLTERMLDLAQVGVGHRVLDVAAGTGDDIAKAIAARPPPSYEERLAVFSPTGRPEPSRDPFKKS
jgi:hypothetical protein